MSNPSARAAQEPVQSCGHSPHRSVSVSPPLVGGYALGLDLGKDRLPVEAALVRAGLAGRVSDDGRFYLISGRRRLRRLAELVGERPPAAPEESWPGGAAA